ncbi:hypothetical protein [Enterococcus olivae]
MRKILFILGMIFLGGVTILMPISSYSFWQDQQMFLHGEKGQTEALIKVDEHKIKTYNFKENDYGVDASKSSWREGDKVTIYFLRSKPYMVSENPYVYHTTAEIFMPLVWCVFVGGLLLGLIYTRSLISKLTT